ncbi:cellulose biosynthesis protein BcsQ [Paenibacillus mucilaginosus]|uniref:AAA family ATPase n=1 Tax=Paenibacillus mucilaginosus TaxID=61624 RepID=UPI003D209C1B
MSKRFLFIGEDSSLRRELQEYDQDTEFYAYRSTEAFDRTVEYDFVLISDREVQSMALGGFVQDLKAHQIFYLISNGPKSNIVENKVALCKQHGIKPILPKQTTTQILQRVLGLTGKSQGYRNVCSVLGTHPQVGTTMITLSMAKQMAEAGQKVGVLGLNQFNSGKVYYENYVGNTLDEMYTQIADRKQILKSSELLNYMHFDEDRKYHYLAGNQDFAKRGYFQSEDIEHLISMAAEQFDVVLLDVGFSPCNNLTLQGLFKSDTKLLVGSQQPISAIMWQQMNNDILNLLSISADEFLLVVNRYNADFPMDTKALQNLMNVPTIGAIPDLGIDGTICEMEKKLLVESRNKTARKRAEMGIESLVTIVNERIAGTQAMARTAKEKSGIWNRLLS